MLDRDLAELYGVTTSALKQAVRRNIERFPNDFMVVLTDNEFVDWRSQFVNSNADRKGLRYAPMAFTEQGVAMLSSVLRSKRAIAVNIEIMRTFVDCARSYPQIPTWLASWGKLEGKYDRQFMIVFDAIRKLMLPIPQQKKPIGFRPRAVKR